MRVTVLGSVLAASALLAGACTQTPGTPSVSFGAPLASGPANGTGFKYSAQPITLTFNNAVRTSEATATYAVEVASDAGFSNKVFTKTDIPEGGGGTTSVQLSQLGGATTYYWRSMTTIDGITGAPSPTLSFAVGPQVVVNIPGLVTPDTNGTATGRRPTFTVANASRSGPAGTVFYEFQVSSGSSFSSLVASGTVQEQSGQTSWSPSADIAEGSYFWRAQALDPSNDVKSGFSSARPFTLKPFSLKDAVIWNNPPDLADWAETALIDWIDFSTGTIVVDFNKRLGPGRWPDVTPAGWSGALQYTLGMCGFINGRWHCSAAIQFWHERELTAGGDIRYVWADWFYDGRWAGMLNYQPAIGENVGFFVVAGNVRDTPTVAVKERSNVQFTPWGTNFIRGR